MKQNITPEQLNELSDKGKEKLRKWWIPRRGDIVYGNSPVEENRLISLVAENVDEKGISDNESYVWIPKEKGLPLLSIGQMIEFLDEDADSLMNMGDHWIVYDRKNDSLFKVELADALWEACKEVLK